MSEQTKALLVGILFVLPFVVMNFVVALRLEPFYSILGSLEVVRSSSLTPLLLLLLFPVGAFIAARPIFKKDISGKRHFYLANAIFATLVIVAFLIVFTALGEETYRCDLLKIANCD